MFRILKVIGALAFVRSISFVFMFELRMNAEDCQNGTITDSMDLSRINFDCRVRAVRVSYFGRLRTYKTRYRSIICVRDE